MTTFTATPTYGAQVNQQPKVRRSSFGDGYIQRTASGINNSPRAWSLTFTKAEADITTINTFLETEGAVTSFDWTPPTGSAGKFVCESWSRSNNAGAHTLTATFSEVFGE